MRDRIDFLRVRFQIDGEFGGSNQLPLLVCNCHKVFDRCGGSFTVHEEFCGIRANRVAFVVRCSMLGAWRVVSPER